MKRIALLLVAITMLSNVFSQNIVEYDVYLRSNYGTDTMWDGNTFDVWGLAGSLAEDPHMPAKTLYCDEGDSLVLNAVSISQNEHHTIHLHGLDADTRNDGDPATSFYLNHLQDTTYSVLASHAGTYLYHCHVADVVHVQLGMYGLIVVKSAGGLNTVYTGGPSYDKEYNWILSEADESWHDNIPLHDENVDTVHIPPYIPGYFLINGLSEQQLLTDDLTRVNSQANLDILIRIGAIGFFDNLIIFPSWLNAEIHASDGRPLPIPLESDSIWIAPGERYDVLLSPADTAEDFIQVHFINMNTDSVWDVQQIPVSVHGFSGVTSIDKKEVEVFPNPGNGVFNIQANRGYKPIEIMVINSLGNIVLKKKFTGEILNLSHLPSGLYSLGTISSTGKAEWNLIVKD